MDCQLFNYKTGWTLKYSLIYKNQGIFLKLLISKCPLKNNIFLSFRIVILFTFLISSLFLFPNHSPSHSDSFCSSQSFPNHSQTNSLSFLTPYLFVFVILTSSMPPHHPCSLFPSQRLFLTNLYLR